MNPELILDTIGVDTIAQYAPTEVMWTCFVAAREQSTNQPVATAPKPTIEVVEEEAATIHVEFEDEPAKTAGMTAKPG